MQHRLRYLQAADHPSGVLAHRLVGRIGEPHELEGIADSILPLAPLYSIQLGEDKEILVSGEGAVGGEHLRHVADDPR